MKSLVRFCLALVLVGAFAYVIWKVTSDGDNGGASGFTPSEITLKTVGQLQELVDEKLVFVDSKGVEWVAPKGTLTDGATVPRLALWVTNGRFDSRFLKAAVVHDAYCQSHNEGRCPEQYQKKPWQAVHRMFYEACRAGGTSDEIASIMFAAVYMGGPRWDDPAGDLQAVPDEVLMAGFEGCKEWIEESNPTPDQIEKWVTQRTSTAVEVSELQAATLQALDNGDQAAAERTLDESDKLIAAKLQEAPDDVMLLNLKGYQHRQVAAKYKAMQMERAANEQLAVAEDSFRQVLATHRENPSALNGVAQVMYSRDELDDAEEFVRRALNVEPNHPAAKRELELIEQRKQGRR